MCFHSKQSKDATTAQQRFKAKVQTGLNWNAMTGIYNGFARPYTPIIAQDECDTIVPAQWGLIPQWADPQKFKANTLNARIETLNEKSTFSSYTHNRCLILSDGFYEWKWLDAQGRRKEKYLITRPEEVLFAFAGIYSHLVMPSTGEVIKTYSIVTTAANALMSEIHNTKKRMPIILTQENEQDWLNGASHHLFDQCLIDLEAQKVQPEWDGNTLFGI